MTNSNVEFPLQTSMNGLSGTVNGKVSEYLIEQYVRFPEMLDGTVEETVGAHLEKHDREKAIEQFYRDFYREYDKLDSNISSSVSAFVSSLFS